MTVPFERKAADAPKASAVPGSGARCLKLRRELYEIAMRFADSRKRRTRFENLRGGTPRSSYATDHHFFTGKIVIAYEGDAAGDRVAQCDCNRVNC
jgi:hypothetical protein